MSVDRLHPVIAHHLVNSLGWRSLRPLQRDAVVPLLEGSDALCLAPTAGGKTESACFPLLTAMEEQQWYGLSVVYVCPLKALLNNLLPRLETYAAWLGRSVAVWHGDVAAGTRRRILREPPDILLTTPESLESMLVSANVDHHELFSGLRAVVVDEVHAFAGDDRGWHLLAVLERLTRIAGRPLQRVGLSATVGNPAELLEWLQGSGRSRRPAVVIAPDLVVTTKPPPGDIELDYVGSVDNAATVITALHRGEKRLVFCDSRVLVEQLGAALRSRGVTTFLSHASLSKDERLRAEQAFAEARDCVIVSTSTLELGIDVGDLDRVIQINAPRTVSSFLQRLGRTGRRAGASRNCLFLALDEWQLLWAAGLLRLWGNGYIEPVTAPPEPRHIVAQQVLAVCLQENKIGRKLWHQEWNNLAPFDQGSGPIMRYLVDEGFIERDGELFFIGPQAEQRFGRRHFMDMMAVFTAPPQFTVLAGRQEIGQTDPSLLTDKVEGPRLLLLAGRSWRVTWIDWKRKRCFVEAADSGGRARWHAPGAGGASFALSRSVRDVLLGEDPPVKLTQRAHRVLAETRDERGLAAHPAGTVVSRNGMDIRWWTWAGYRANATLAATLGGLTDEKQRFDDVSIRLRTDLTSEIWRTGFSSASSQLSLPEVDERALAGLKFNEALSERLAIATLSARLADLDAASAVLSEPARFVVRGQ
ncbi:ATP-dependent helicase Lhr and Lhr-like helicase [Amycolatopsis lurida]|uniref:ATP-dependent helicase n=1 Tax=Amycolatopsis lurida NRRL 2430 TaxID=1460371 RepID=A0A2P2FZ20_AMYLU|nr:DEAD/DEAH box helicase [Amycolatopsis lurida]KFU81959.1 ATP-dependent helicase [Amycolatopsis lurida NRRL 2430]SEC39483.1 ATP-dependent helicase Lhr and Lhr-like helicase [Amycolatopsis lurida]